jgi:hypothetical protein
MPIDLIPDLSNFIILIVIVDKTFCPLAAACLGHQSIRNAFSTIPNNAVGEFHVFSTLLGRQRTAIKAQILRLVTAPGNGTQKAALKLQSPARVASVLCTRGLGSPHPKLIYVNCKTPVGGPRLHQTLPNVLCMCLPCSEFYDWPISLTKPDILELILLRPRPTPRLPWPSLPRRISFHQPYVVLP